MRVALVMAERSTCPKGHVGAVLTTPDGRILSVGYNGVPAGVAHCTETGCLRGEDGKHLYLVHAEENAVANAAANGVDVRGSTAYITRVPCSHCAAILVQAGVEKVVCASEEGMTAAALDIFRWCRILTKGIKVQDERQEHNAQS